MKNIIINHNLNKDLSDLAYNPPSSLLITGPKSSGKEFIMDYFAKKIASQKPNSKIIKIQLLPDKKHILIEQIKDVIKILKVKDEAYRIILIPDAELMTLDAQNSLLKALEEPPRNVIFMLTSSLPDLLLQTILSRVIKIKYVRPGLQQFTDYANEHNISNEQAQKYLKITQMRAGAFCALVNNQTNNSLLNDIETAKDILSETPKERITRIDALAKDNEMALRILESLILIGDTALDSGTKKGEYKSWLKRLKLLNESYELILKNVSAKLVLTKLFLVL